MSNIDIFTMSVRNMFKRKLRTFLTILGVIVGTAAIVVMMSLGLAMNKTFDDELAKMGDITTVTVYNPGYNATNSKNEKILLDDNAIVKFKQMPGVVTATALEQTYLYFKSGRYVMSASVYGIDPEAMEAMGYEAAEGRLLESTDKNGMVFGSKAEYQFYDPKKGYSDRYWKAMYSGEGGEQEEIAPLVHLFRDRISYTYDWEYIYGDANSSTASTIKPYDGKTVGLLKDKDYNTDGAIFMNIATLQKIKSDQQKFEQSRMQQYGYYSSNRNQGQNQQNKNYDRVYVKCVDLSNVRKVKAMIDEMGYYAEIPSSNVDSMQQMSSSLQALLGAIGAVSLFIAAIGIANTMIMAIYERTREIGVMKVIGAAISDIRKLFLLEAAMIGFFGGVFGVLLSIGISHLLNTTDISFMGMIDQYMSMQQSQVSLITPWLCGLALLFATLVGLVSGYFPARRAMRLSALSAIRTE